MTPRPASESRRGGAGPSDHKALTIDGMTVMVPVHTAPAFESPYLVEKPDAGGRSRISRDGVTLAEVSFPARPRFYDLSTADGIPYWKIAVLHGRDVLATTVLQTCIRYQSRTKTCQFCAIGQSLAAGRTVERKTPAQLAEVAKAAVELDGVKHMVMTTGTPPGRRSRRGDPGRERRGREGCGRPADPGPMRAAGRRRLVPPHEGRRRRRARHASRSGDRRSCAHASCRARRRSRSSAISTPSRRPCPCSGAARCRPTSWPASATRREAILETCEKLIALGVYPFVVPFVPISGTPLESHPAPSPAFMHEILRPLATMLRDGGAARDRHQGRLRQVRRLLGALDL